MADKHDDVANDDADLHEVAEVFRILLRWDDEAKAKAREDEIRTNADKAQAG